MHAKASNGMQSNNFKFSSCSHARIESRLNELIQNPRDWPFIQDSTGFCGNQVVERDANATAGAGEECDCGYEVRLQSAAISQICLAVFLNVCIAPLERDRQRAPTSAATRKHANSRLANDAARRRACAAKRERAASRTATSSVAPKTTATSKSNALVPVLSCFLPLLQASTRFAFQSILFHSIPLSSCSLTSHHPFLSTRSLL